MIDLHTHILPGMDDGAADIYDTLEMAGSAVRCGVKAMVATALNIKPYMKATGGTIQQIGQARGIKKALDKMIDYIGEVGTNLTEKVVVIAHCNCLERAKSVEKKLLEKYAFKDSLIIDTKGISSMYANDGGVIVSF